MEGEPAVAEPVVIFSDTEDAWIMDGVTDENGTVAFYLPDGFYHVISGWETIPGASVYTIAENVSVKADTNLTLDEREALVVDFDTNKSDQIMAERDEDVCYNGEYISVCFGALHWYPIERKTYITPTTLFNGTFVHSYYPEKYYNATDPGFINTPEWHKLIFWQAGITENITFVVDYDILAEITTDYKVALEPDLAAWAQHAFCPGRWSSWTYVWRMDAPQGRDEWISPEPAFYYKWYEQYAEWWNETYPCWSYDIPYQKYPAGTKTYFAMGEHPLKSGTKIDIPWEGTLDIYGTISEDTFGNSFANWTRDISGNLTVIKDGEVVIDHVDIRDHFWEYVYFSGTPRFSIIIQGNSSPRLSTYTRTEMEFIADPARDYQPPGVTMRAMGSDLNNTVPGDNVKIEMDVEDESNISDATLEYSVDEGNTWNLTILTKIYEEENVSKYEADLGYMNNTFASLRANATDSEGNSVSQTVIKGFYVSEKIESIFDTEAPSNPYPSILGNHTGTITPNADITVSKLYTYPCAGTGGHTEYAAISYSNGTQIAEAHWNGYVEDWHNISFNTTFTLYENETYNYTIRTGSYPQIIHETPFNATGGTITCDKFIDANGRIYYDWIPAIRLA